MQHLQTFMEIVIKTNLRIQLNLYTISKLTTTINKRMRMTAVTCKDMEKEKHVFTAGYNINYTDDQI